MKIALKILLLALLAPAASVSAGAPLPSPGDDASTSASAALAPADPSDPTIWLRDSQNGDETDAPPWPRAPHSALLWMPGDRAWSNQGVMDARGHAANRESSS